MSGLDRVLRDNVLIKSFVRSAIFEGMRPSGVLKTAVVDLGTALHMVESGRMRKIIVKLSRLAEKGDPSSLLTLSASVTELVREEISTLLLSGAQSSS